MKKAVLCGCGANAKDPGRILIHRYVSSHPNDDFDVLDAGASISPYEMSQRINACEGLIIISPHTFAGLPFSLQFFMRRSVFMLKKGMPAVFLVYTELAEPDAVKPSLYQLSRWAEKAGLEVKSRIGLARIGELERHPESTLKAGWLRPLSGCFALMDQTLNGQTVVDHDYALWSPAGLYRQDLYRFYEAEGRKNGNSPDEIRGEARYAHYL